MSSISSNPHRLESFSSESLKSYFNYLISIQSSLMLMCIFRVFSIILLTFIVELFLFICEFTIILALCHNSKYLSSFVTLIFWFFNLSYIVISRWIFNYVYDLLQSNFHGFIIKLFKCIDLAFLEKQIKKKNMVRKDKEKRYSPFYQKKCL